MMALIPIHDRHGNVRCHAVIDDSDYENIATHRWCLDGWGYVMRYVGKRPHRKALRLHRVLLGLLPGDGKEGDHRSGDKLDNRRANLRVCTHAENVQNLTVLRADNRSGYRGVHWHAGRRKWVASICVAGRRRSLGYFMDVHEAGRAAAEARAVYMPFAGEA